MERLQSLSDFINKDNHWLVLAGTGAVLIGGITKRKKKSWPKDTVVLHSVDKGIWDMSLTPFAVKLETYFRLADIPYINNPTRQQSSKKKIPWIEYNGETVADSAFIVEYLNKKKKKSWPKDTVVLHSVDKGIWDMSLTPFAVKLETYFRLADIPYINNPTRQQSSKKKIPWIEYNGETVADSAFIVEYLNKKTMVMSRWYHDIYKVNPPGLGLMASWVLPIFARMIYKQGWQQGMGRHSRDEVLHIMEEDLQAVSLFLDKKKFLFGEKPCEVDCAVFGQLSQFCWHMPGLYGETLIHEKYPNLREYCYIMKKAFWPELGTNARSKLEKKST